MTFNIVWYPNPRLAAFLRSLSIRSCSRTIEVGRVLRIGRSPPAARMSSPRSLFSNSSAWRSRLAVFVRTTFELRLRFVIQPPFVAPHRPTADRPDLVSMVGEDERQA